MGLFGFVKDVLVDGLGGSNVVWAIGSQAIKSKLPQWKEMGYEEKPKFGILKGLNQFYYDLPVINQPRSVPAKIELHEAKRAGTHLDFRFKVDGRVYDFAVVKTDIFPEKTGIVQRVVRRHNHSLKYFDKESFVFPEGSYGEGKMKTIWRGDIDIIEMSPEKMEFSINEGKFQGRYCIFTEKSPILNEAAGMIRMKDPVLIHKDRSKFSSDPKKLEVAYGDPDTISEWKVDGANYTLRSGDKPGTNQLISRRLSVTGEPINQVDKLPSLKFYKIPDKFKNRAIHGEVSTTYENVAKTAGTLNSNSTRSRNLQSTGKYGDRLVFNVWDIEGEGTYEERSLELRELAKSSPRIDNRYFGDRRDQFWFRRITNPRVIAPVANNRDLKCSPKEFTDLVKQVGGEGTVLKNLKAKYYEDTWLKDKASDTHTLKIINFKEGNEKYTGSLGALIVESDDGTIKGTVGTGFSDELRQNIWDNREDLKGSYIEAECHEVTENGVLRGPRFKEFSRG